MTEAEWLNCGFSDPMMEWLRQRPNLGRKRRLLAVACCRRVWKWMPEACRPAVETAERLAEGSVREEERWAAYVAAGEAYDGAHVPEAWAGYCAYRAVENPSDSERPTSWDDDAAAWVAQTAAQPPAWRNRQWDNAILTGERVAIADLIRDIFGNPFRPIAIDPTWLMPNVVNLARAIYEEPAFDRLPFLADALEEAGCTNTEILAHCRGPGAHVRGCWVVDLSLGKN